MWWRCRREVGFRGVGRIGGGQCSVVVVVVVGSVAGRLGRRRGGVGVWLGSTWWRFWGFGWDGGMGGFCLGCMSGERVISQVYIFGS